ncbi:MAG: hypothetical protein KKB29_01245 [Nanoarchaeota archaeon]|nr:hypothetical protein [Nanoarchaeota archaeon]
MEQVKIDNKEIIDKLNDLQGHLEFIREHIEDVTLTSDDLEAINEARNDFEEGKTKRL